MQRSFADDPRDHRPDGAELIQLKGWTVTLAAALEVFLKGEARPAWLFVPSLPVIAFWLLDAWYLRRERLFRRLFDHVRTQNGPLDFSIDVRPFAGEVGPVLAVAMSSTIIGFYGPVLFRGDCPRRNPTEVGCMASTAGENQRAPRVFVSYSHDSAEHCNRVLELATRLRADGLDAQIDQFENSPPQGWPLWCARQILDSNYVLIICTAVYRDRFLGLEDFGKGRGVKWEAKVIHNTLYYNEVNSGFIPVIFNPSDGNKSRKPSRTLHGISFCKTGRIAQAIPHSVSDWPVAKHSRRSSSRRLRKRIASATTRACPPRKSGTHRGGLKRSWTLYVAYRNGSIAR